MVSSWAVGTKSPALIVSLTRNFFLNPNHQSLPSRHHVILVAFRYAIHHHSAEGLGRKKRSLRAQATQSHVQHTGYISHTRTLKLSKCNSDILRVHSSPEFLQSRISSLASGSFIYPQYDGLLIVWSNGSTHYLLLMRNN